MHAGGLRYHGMAPTVSQLVDEGLLEPKAYNQLATYEAGMIVAKSEGFISAPETNHALACVIDLAKQAKEEGQEKVILFNFSGHGVIDLGAYEQFLSGNLTDYEIPAEEIAEAEKILEQYPKPEHIKSR
jgi:tryptophan synthase beta chain